jgi:hypothetical protein
MGNGIADALLFVLIMIGPFASKPDPLDRSGQNTLFHVEGVMVCGPDRAPRA